MMSISQRINRAICYKTGERERAVVLEREELVIIKKQDSTLSTIVR